MESQAYETLIAAVIFAAIFFFGAWLRLPKKKQHRRLMSFAAGVSVAYVFIHLIPELQHASEAYISAKGHVHTPVTVYFVYLAAMIGFIVFYGLEHLVISSRSKAASKSTADKAITPVFLLHIAGFALYTWLVTYLLLHSIEETIVPIALYSFAMGLHLFSIDHSLRREHGSSYARLGKNILAAAALLGWVVGMLIELPVSMVVPLLGFVSGAVIMNSMIMELPSEKEGKFFPFLLGGIVYAWLLLVIA
jgi:hypothetical protein